MEAGRATPAGVAQQGFAMIPPAGVLGWLPPSQWWTVKDFYGYSANFLPLAAGATETQNISIQADTDFIIMYATAIVTAVDNTTPLAFAPALIELRDASTGATMTQLPVHLEALFGDGSFPGIFAVPKFVRANGAIAVTLQNLEAFNRNYRINLFGYRSIPGSDIRRAR